MLTSLVAARFVTTARFDTKVTKRAAMPARFVTNEVVTNRAGIVLFFLFLFFPHLDISTFDIVCVICVYVSLCVCVCVCVRACVRARARAHVKEREKETEKERKTETEKERVIARERQNVPQQRCLVVTWLPHETASNSVHVLYTPYNHAPVYSVTLFEKLHTLGVCVLICNLPPALLAE